MSGRGRVVLVTGVSAGIGRDVVLECLRRGHRVSGCARREDRLAALAADAAAVDAVGAAGADRFHAVAADVNQRDEMAAWIEDVASRWGGIDAVIHNAGFGINGPVEALELEHYRRQLETNFFAVVSLTRQAIPLLRKRGGGDLVFVSSVLGLVGLPGRSAYCASKWAVEGFAASIRPELRRHGIRVSVVNPGFTESDFAATMEVVGYRGPRSRTRPMSSARVAREIAGCLGRTRRNVVLTALGKAGLFCHRYLPWPLERATERTFLAEIGERQG